MIHNRTCSRILGFSEHFESRSAPYIVHYYQNDDENYTLYSRRLRNLFPSIYCVNSCEISQDGQYALLAGVSNNGYNKNGKAAPGYPILYICKMTEKLYKVNSKILCHTQKTGFPSRIRRVRGNNVYLIGCKKHIFIYKFENELLEHITTVENVHDNQIVDLQLKNDYLYSIARDEPKLGITQFFKGTSRHEVRNSIDMQYEALKKSRINVGPYGKLEKVAAFGNKVFVGGNGLHIFSEYIGNDY